MIERENQNRKIINYMIIIAILFIIMWLCIEGYKENKIKKQDTKISKYDVQNIATNYVYRDKKVEENEDKNQVNRGKNQKNENNESNQIQERSTNQTTKDDITEETPKIYPKQQVISEYRGYDVLAKLEIPNINLETYILKTYSTSALNISVTKFWGANPNTIGNFCVAGHNFKNKNMFRNLKNLNIGNHFFITDNTVGKVEYEIFDIYKVIPEDVSCLSQDTGGKKEVTLITCTNDSAKRIIVKAREI